MYIIGDEQWAHESQGQMRNLRILMIELCQSLICRYFNCPQDRKAHDAKSSSRSHSASSNGSDYALSTSEDSRLNSPSKNASEPYVVPFKDFILNAVHRTRTPLNAIALALMYVSRLRTMNPHCAGTAVTPHRVMLSAVMLACKILYDDTYSNKTWVHVSQGMFNLTEINRMEWEFLEYIRFRLVVHRGDWLNFLHDLDVRLCVFVGSGRSLYFESENDTDAALRKAAQSVVGYTNGTKPIERAKILLPTSGSHSLSVTREIAAKMIDPDTLILNSSEVALLAQISFHPRRSMYASPSEDIAAQQRKWEYRTSKPDDLSTQSNRMNAVYAHEMLRGSVHSQAWPNGLVNGNQYPGGQYIHHPLSRYALAPQYALHHNGAPSFSSSHSDSEGLSQASDEELNDAVSMECSMSGDRDEQRMLAQEYTQQYASQFGPFFDAAIAANASRLQSNQSHTNGIVPHSDAQITSMEITREVKSKDAQSGSGRKRSLPSTCATASSSPGARVVPGCINPSAASDLMSRAHAILSNGHEEKALLEAITQSDMLRAQQQSLKIEARRASFAESKRGDSATDVFAEHSQRTHAQLEPIFEQMPMNNCPPYLNQRFAANRTHGVA